MIVIIHDPEYTRPMKLAAILISRYGLKRTVEAWDGVMPLEDGMLARRGTVSCPWKMECWRLPT